MKQFVFLFSFFLSHFVNAQTAEQKFSARELQNDLLYMAQTMENVHVNLYHSTSKEKFWQLKDSIAGKFRDSMTATEAWPLFARLMGAVNEGHGEIDYPADFLAKVQSGLIEVFPVLIKGLQNDRLIVNYNLSGDSNLKRDDEIIAINGIKVPQLLEQISAGLGGLKNWKETRVLGDFITYLYLYRITPPFTIDYVQNNSTKSIQVNAITFQTLKERVTEIRKTLPATPPAVPYSYTTMDDIGYFDFRTMNTDYEKFKIFVDSVFTTIKKSSISGLIIDLRKNGGGNSNLGYLLLKYISNKSFRMAGGSKWKVSQELKNFYIDADEDYKERTKSKPWNKYLKKANGTVITADAGKPAPPGKNPLRYDGKVCFLVGAKTFSSANMTANAVQDYKLATLIGEPTGEVPNDYGEIFTFKLPNTKIVVRTTSTFFTRANGEESDTNPVLPDILIKQNPSSAKDDVLEFAKNWIRKKD